MALAAHLQSWGRQFSRGSSRIAPIAAWNLTSEAISGPLAGVSCLPGRMLVPTRDGHIGAAGSRAMAAAATKIKVENPVVDLDGDEMTR